MFIDKKGVSPTIFGASLNSELVYYLPVSDYTFRVSKSGDTYAYLEVSNKNKAKVVFDLSVLPNNYVNVTLADWVVTKDGEDYILFPPASCSEVGILINASNKFTPNKINDSWSTDVDFFNTFGGFFCNIDNENKLKLEHI
jgi:hypothetical protein